ncbi:MAG: glycosyltransferase family 39 protein [Bacteroidota bacterium]
MQLFVKKYSNRVSVVDAACVVAIAIALFFIQKDHLRLDFWNDEIYTLKNFVFVPISTTLTDYHIPNNHIFFNLLNNIFLKLIGIHHLHDLMENPILVRILPFTYALMTLWLVYFFGKKFFSLSVGILSVIILLTSVGFFNFGLQVRGYSLSMLLLMTMIYGSASYIRADKNKYLYLTAVAACLAFFTVPINIYPILGTATFFFFASVFFKYKKQHRTSIKYFKVDVALGLGSLLGFIFYLPNFEAVFFNEYVISQHAFNSKVFEEFIPGFWKGYLNKRYLLTYLLIGGIGVSVLTKKGFFFKNENVLLFTTCCVPFLLNFVRGEEIPERALSMLIPILSIVLGVGIVSIFRINNKVRTFALLGVFLIGGYCYYVFQNEIVSIEAQLQLNLHGGHRSQNLTYNYYMAHYQPLAAARYFHDNYSKKSSPLVVFSCEPHGFYNYLEKFDISYLKKDALMDLLKNKVPKVFVVARFPNEVHQYIKDHFGDTYDVQNLQVDFTYNNFLRLTVKS